MAEPTPVAPKKRFVRTKKWMKRLVISVLVLLFLYHVPLWEYLWRVGASITKTGLSRETAQSIAEDSDWFWRFFTGPPSDAEMIAFFEKNRATFERLAYLKATDQCLSEQQKKTCNALAKQLNVFVFANSHIENTIYPQSRGAECITACRGQEYSFEIEGQNWWRSTNPGIDYWKKGLLYVPPLLPAETFGLDPGRFPSDPDEVVWRLCSYHRASLDTLVPQLEEEPIYSEGCGYRPIGDGWYLTLIAGYNLRTPWFGSRFKSPINN